MRERVTFLHAAGADIDPTTLDIQEAGLVGPLTEATREDRLTLTLEELPLEIADLLRGGFAEFHLRWASPVKYDTLEPFSSRVSPGLHVSFTPSKDAAVDQEKLCSLLKIFGPLDCASKDAFTVSRSKRVSNSQSLYFYQELDNLHAFAKTAVSDFCPASDSICQSRALSLFTAASLDFTYDGNSQQVKLTSFWPLRQQTILVPASSTRRTEVGVLGRNSPSTIEAHEVGVAGVLIVLGEHTKPSPTIFAFPSRHRSTGATFSSKFLAPTGLHPTLQLSVSSNSAPVEDANCAPYAYLTLPKTIFADRYQLEDELFLASKNLSASPYTSMPVNLEAPAYKTATWGSNVLMKLAPPVSNEPESWTAEVPLHLRYLEPSATGEVKTEIPYPVVFWACDSHDAVNSPNNPFDRPSLGYDNLFRPTTAFWHVNPEPEIGNRLTNPITVPVLKDTAAQWIGTGTAVAVTLGFTWVLWKLISAYSQTGHGSQQPQKEQDKKTE